MWKVGTTQRDVLLRLLDGRHLWGNPRSLIGRIACSAASAAGKHFQELLPALLRFRSDSTEGERNREAPAVHPKGHPAKLPDGLFAALPQQVIAPVPKVALVSESVSHCMRPTCALMQIAEC
jgi:hypothetical protein